MALKQRIYGQLIRISHPERGANLVEYALLVALIAIVCVGAVSMLGGTTNEPIEGFGSQLGK